MKNLETFDLKSWLDSITNETREQAIQALELGKVLYFPQLSFSLSPHEHSLLCPSKTHPKSKNISYDIRNDKLAGTQCTDEEVKFLRDMIRRFALNSRKLLNNLFPHYIPHLNQARTSFRPVEIAGRKTSYRKDDTRLHVDSFPATPTNGKRILRVFSNINLDGKPRIWRLGEPFAEVVKNIAPRTSKPLPGIRTLYKLLKLTKEYRTLYDHYMLQIHDTMKGDNYYQNNVVQEEFHFPAGSTWIAYTDQTSHAAMSGQHLLEQTFHLPSTAMLKPELTPLAVLEKYFNKKLV